MESSRSFSRASRLLVSRDFGRVFDKADYKAGSEALLLLARDNDLAQPRIGFVISKKNVRTAARRNALRRQLRESFRLQRMALPAIDIVVLTRRSPVQCDPRSLRSRFDELLQKLTRQYRKKHGEDSQIRNFELE